jgi:hypothetical protein
MKKWAIVFVVPASAAGTFEEQKIMGGSAVWRSKMAQYVLVLSEDDVMKA